MISLTQQPSALTFAKNPVIFKLHATHADGSPFAPRGARQTVVFTEASIGTTAKILITITETDGTSHGAVFSFSDNPTGDFSLPTWQPNPMFPVSDFGGFIENVAGKIGRNYMVSPFFILTTLIDPFLDSYAVIFTAIDPAITFTLAVQNLPNATIQAQEAAVSDSTPTNYGVVYEIYGEKFGGVFSTLFEGITTPDTEGGVHLNIQDIVEPLREHSPILPPNCTDIRAHRADNIRRYYFRYAEQSGAPTVRASWYIGEPLRVIYGGTAQNLLAQSDWFATSKLLNTLPDGRTVGAYDPEYLVYYNGTAATQNLKVSWEAWSRNDAAQSSGVNDYLSLIAGPGESLMIPALTFHDYRDSTAAFRIQLWDDNNDPVTPWRRYIIDRRYREDIRFLMFLNNYGVFETVRMTGITTTSAEIDRRESARFVGEVVETFEAEKRWKRAFTYRTGYMSERELAALEGLLSSRHVFEVSTTEGYMPLRILETKKDLNTPTADLEAWEIKAAPRIDYGQPSPYLWTRW